MKQRFAFIDLHRGWVLFLMIETHVFNAMLLSELKDSTWFGILTFINGLIAPSFIFISGFAFNIAVDKKIEEFRKYKFQFWRQLGRIILIWLAGYALHLPYLSLHKMQTEATEQQLLSFFNVDVLQCIAAGLLFLFVIRLLVRNEKVYNFILNFSFLAILISSPYLWKTDLKEFLPIYLSDYFTPKYGSFFPVFPWVAFMIAGAICSRYFLLAKRKDFEKTFINSLLVSFSVLIVFCFIVIRTGFFNVQQPDPFFFLLRLGLIILLLISFWYYEQWRKTEKSVILDVSRESLLVYWLHLQVIYREFWNQTSFNSIVNQRLNILEATLVTILIAALMMMTAIFWGKLKLKYPKTFRYFVIGEVSIILLIFIIN